MLIWANKPLMISSMLKIVHCSCGNVLYLNITFFNNSGTRELFILVKQGPFLHLTQISKHYWPRQGVLSQTKCMIATQQSPSGDNCLEAFGGPVNRNIYP